MPRKDTEGLPKLIKIWLLSIIQSRGVSHAYQNNRTCPFSCCPTSRLELWDTEPAVEDLCSANYVSKLQYFD
jgi:hypothetical protein